MRTWAFVVAMALLAPISWAESPRSQTPAADPLLSPKLRIDWPEFKKLYDSQMAVVIDVRERVSFEAGHIPGARSIPLEEIESRAAELKKLNKPILLYCA